MTRPENNKFGVTYEVPEDWDLTTDGPVPLDDILTSRDILPVVRNLYGTPLPDDAETFVLPRHWARDNPDTVQCFFSVEKLTDELRVELGY